MGVRTMQKLGAHPRACGENFWGLFRSGCVWGSSPRVRGKHTFNFCHKPHTRLIPARAGKTKSALPFGAPLAAHPRACGENR